MNQRKAKALRKEAKAIIRKSEGTFATNYLAIDPNLSDFPVFAGPSTGVKRTLMVDPTCLRGVYLDLKNTYKKSV